MRTPLATLTTLALGACGPSADLTGLGGPTLTVTVAPLELPGIDLACYDLAIVNGAGDPVISRGDPDVRLDQGDGATLCSTRFGNGPGGDISYIAPCDASLPEHTVTLWVDGLYSGSVEAPVHLDYQDPCPSGCELTATCAENADTPVSFNLTIMRPANQGFFDLAINFRGVFCAAKVDCVNDGGQPLNLLHHPVSGVRGQTAVVALACTAGPGLGGTVLLRDDLTITCGEDSWHLDPSAPEGNVYAAPPAPNAAPDGSPVWQYAVYAGQEDLPCGAASCEKVYWNVAIGFDPLADGCTLTATATAGDPDTLPAFETPEGATWPLIEVDLPLTLPDGGRACSRHPLNGEPGGVTTDYTAIDAAWSGCRRFDGLTMTTEPTCDEDTVWASCAAVRAAGGLPSAVYLIEDPALYLPEPELSIWCDTSGSYDSCSDAWLAGRTADGFYDIAGEDAYCRLDVDGLHYRACMFRQSDQKLGFGCGGIASEHWLISDATGRAFRASAASPMVWPEPPTNEVVFTVSWQQLEPELSPVMSGANNFCLSSRTYNHDSSIFGRFSFADAGSAYGAGWTGCTTSLDSGQYFGGHAASVGERLYAASAWTSVDSTPNTLRYTSFFFVD